MSGRPASPLPTVRRWLIQALRSIFGTALALLILFEEWGWLPLQALLARLARWPPLRTAEALIRRLPPWPALALFALPTLALLPQAGSAGADRPRPAAGRAGGDPGRQTAGHRGGGPAVRVGAACTAATGLVCPAASLVAALEGGPAGPCAPQLGLAPRPGAQARAAPALGTVVSAVMSGRRGLTRTATARCAPPRGPARRWSPRGRSPPSTACR